MTARSRCSTSASPPLPLQRTLIERGVDVARRDSSASPIITPAITTTGIILGTAAYMSPEQAKGNPVTRTTDIWAFGCVLYEMLTGRVPFKGDSTTDTLALIVRGEPDFGLLPSTTPPPIRTLLRHCLHKEQRRRWPDAGSLRIAIEDARDAPADVATPAELTRPSNWRRMIVSAFVVAGCGSTLRAWRVAPDPAGAAPRSCARPHWRVAGEPDRPPAGTAQRTAFSFGHRVVTGRPVARVHRRIARRPD